MWGHRKRVLRGWEGGRVPTSVAKIAIKTQKHTKGFMLHHTIPHNILQLKTRLLEIYDPKQLHLLCMNF